MNRMLGRKKKRRKREAKLEGKQGEGNEMNGAEGGTVFPSLARSEERSSRKVVASLSLSRCFSIVPGLPFSYSLLMTFLSYFSMFSNYIHDFDF